MIEEDNCAYIKRSKDQFLIMYLYVDDILIAGNSKEYILEIKGWLPSKFELKDMGEAASKFEGIDKRSWCLFHKSNTSRKPLSNSECKIVNPLILLWQKVRP